MPVPVPTEPKNAVVKWVAGRKTYAVALAVLTCGVLRHYGVVVPEFVWVALAAFGLAFLRAGVQKGELH